MSLHAITHDNRSKLWCGLAALATVTGRPTSECATLLRQIRGGKPVKGVHTFELRRAFEKLGYQVTHVPGRRKITLAAWLRDYANAYQDHAVVVVVSNHFVAVEGRKFCDSHTKQPVFLKAAPWRRARVHDAFQVIRVSAPSWTAPARPARDYEAERRRRGILALAEEFGIGIEEHFPGEWWVWPPKGFGAQGVDPYYDEHLAYDADDRAARVRAYADLVVKSKGKNIVI